MPVRPTHLEELSVLVAGLRTKADAKRLLQDLLTPQELEEVAKRWQVTKLLWQHVPQREVARRLKVSISKVTRCSQTLQRGSGGWKASLVKQKVPRVPRAKR
jgi:Trp operon repressor